MLESSENQIERVTKYIQYAWPSSANAAQFGFETTGCFVVELITPWTEPIQCVAFLTKEEAKNHADKLTQKYDPCFDITKLGKNVYDPQR